MEPELITDQTTIFMIHNQRKNRDKTKPKPKSKWVQDLEKTKEEPEKVYDKSRPENREVQVIKPVGDK